MSARTIALIVFAGFLGFIDVFFPASDVLKDDWLLSLGYGVLFLSLISFLFDLSAMRKRQIRQMEIDALNGDQTKVV